MITCGITELLVVYFTGLLIGMVLMWLLKKWS